MNAVFPSDRIAKRQIIETGKRVYDKGFVAANDGNISCKVSDDTIWTTPTGVSKGFMTEDTLVKMRLDGTVLSPDCKPSSEVKMHIRAYCENPEIKAVIHTHSPVATAFAVAGIALNKAIYPEALVNLGSVPCVHYATPGTQGVADSIAPYCKDYNALLLANHGVITWGRSLEEAFFRMESLEHYAKIYMYSVNIIGKANILSVGQISELSDVRKNLGIKGGVLPLGVEVPSNLEDIVHNGE